MWCCGPFRLFPGWLGSAGGLCLIGVLDQGGQVGRRGGGQDRVTAPA